jgi:hypothetical protein
VADGGAAAASGWLSIVLLLVVGFIVHVLTNQMLLPEHWMAWYAPKDVVDPGGHSLHYWHLPRFLFFIALSAPVVGGLALRRIAATCKARRRTDAGYIGWLRHWRRT